MRRLWLAAVAALVSAALLWVGHGLWQRLSVPLLRLEAPADFADHEVGLGYVVAEDTQPGFRLPPGADRLRVLVNGAWNGPQPVPETRFSLIGTYRDESGLVLGRESVFFRAGRTLYPRDAAPPLAAVSFEEPDRVALDLRIALLYPPSGTASVQFEPGEGPPGLVDVVLRLYGPNTLTPGTEQVAWQRLRRVEKQRIAGATIEDYRFLPAREIAALVRTIWRPIGPVGIKDRDYRMRRVFIPRHVPPAAPEVLIAQPEVPVLGPGRAVTVPLPESGGCLSMTLTPLSVPLPATITPTAAPRLFWTLHRRGDTPLTRVVPLQIGVENGVQLDVQPGDRMIELRSEEPALLRVTLNRPPPASPGEDRERAAEWDITPPLTRIETWRARPQTPLQFGFHGSPNEATALRLNLIALPADFAAVDQAGPVLPTQSRAEVRFKNADGRILDQQTLVWRPAPDPYTSLAPLALGVPLGIPLVRVFTCPPGTRLVEVDTAALVQVALRPADLPLVRAVPGDYADYQGESRPIPLWFSLAPRQAAALRRADHAFWLVRQQRPPELAPELLTGTAWNEALDLEPAGAGRVLWLPRARDGFFETRAAAATYLALPVGQAVSVDFIADGRAALAPALLFVRPPEPGSLKIFLEGKHQQSLTTSAPFGVLSLPPVSAGTHVLRVEADPATRLFLNHRLPEDNYLLRVFARTLDQPLWVDVEKEADSAVSLVVTLFTPRPATENTLVVTRLEGVDPRRGGTAFTPREGRFTVQPAEDDALGQGEPRYDAGQRFFVPLGDDLPAGTYRLWLEKVEGPARLVRVTRQQSLTRRPTSLRPAPAAPTPKFFQE
ncbi:hypothetical protein [Acanthopleuribacter pedis]|uniref:Uncharacterized protein n=1 Tax=Acanthopleuribacter pedis TaxID=442870 RepID=A0A8J7QI61_9BACT|nr:hypothetical protein [Acanthopleuribacter pedis]MBO1321101.1 hypothetical protein [Acanthopleuribacter pedis]